MKGGRGPHDNTQSKSLSYLVTLARHRRLFQVSGDRGYTVIEVMIFLAVTAALFGMIAVTFSRQQGRTQFSTAARDVESRLLDIANDVSTGYYTRRSNFRCQATATGPQFSAGADQLGTNQGCIFIGRMVQFGIVASPADRYNVYTIAGLRLAPGTTREVQNFTEALPRVVGPPVDLTDQLQLPGGMTVARMYYVPPSGVNANVDAIGFFSGFGSYDNGSLKPGSLTVRVVPILGAGSPGATRAEVENTVATTLGTLPANLPGRTVICFNSGTSNQYAELSLGGSGRDLATDMEIREGTCP